MIPRPSTRRSVPSARRAALLGALAPVPGSLYPISIVVVPFAVAFVALSWGGALACVRGRVELGGGLLGGAFVAHGLGVVLGRPGSVPVLLVAGLVPLAMLGVAAAAAGRAASLRRRAWGEAWTVAREGDRRRRVRPPRADSRR